MRNILFLTLVILIIQPVWGLGYSEHINYLSKIIPEVEMPALSFSDIDLATKPVVLSWLKDLDTKLNPSELGVYDADFLLSFSPDGHIKAISIAELHESNLDKFKFFITKLQVLQAQSLPAEIEPGTVFQLDGNMLYIERDESYLVLKPKAESLKSKADPSIIIDSLQSSAELNVELLEPSYIDYPHIGEALVFRLDDTRYKDLKLYSHVISVEDQSMLVKLDRVDDKLINLVFRIDRPSKDSRSTLATVINSGLGSAAGAGITASVVSNGIIPGVLALTNMAGTLMKEREELLSFNLVKGDEVILVKNRGETK